MARELNPNITEEQRARKREAQKRWLEKKKAEEANTVPVVTDEPDYKKLYLEAIARNNALEAQLTEFDKICKSYAERERQANQALQKATIEYNARIKYMLDCVKHAHISMQFATMAKDEPKGDA
jgi:mRNA degradation ribonuclease J1/J2